MKIIFSVLSIFFFIFSSCKPDPLIDDSKIDDPIIGNSSVDVIKNGKPEAIIVISDKSTPIANYAAEEMVRHIEKGTGVKLSIFSESNTPNTDKNKIFIGITNSTLKQNIKPQHLGPDEFVLRTIDNNLYIVGNETERAQPLDDKEHSFNGTLFGVYDILERFLNVKWLWPGELGTEVPYTDNVIIRSLSENIKPKLEFSMFRYSDIESTLKFYPSEVKELAFSDQGLKNYAKDLKVFVKRHRVNYTRKPITGHYFEGWWDKLGEKHPEWFLLNSDGTRGPSKNGSTKAVPMCVSNTELHKYIIEHDWDGGDLLRLGEADASAYCVCDKCMSWDAKQPLGDPRKRIITDRYARFWKIIYDMAVKINPNVKVTTFLYVNYFPAPLSDIKLNKNIYGEFVPFMPYMIWYPSTEENLEWQKQNWLDWKKTGITIGYRPNHTKAGYALPHVNTWQGGEFIRWAYKQGMTGIDYDALNGQWAVKGPEHYMYFRLLVDPTKSIRDIREEYFSAFGPAAKTIEEYFDHWENYNFQLLEEGRWHDIRTNPGEAPRQYPPEVFSPAVAILDKALNEATKSENKKHVKRVQFLKDGLEHGRLSARFVEKISNDSPEAKGALKELTDFRRAHEAEYISNYVYLALRQERRFFGEKIDKLK